MSETMVREMIKRLIAAVVFFTLWLLVLAAASGCASPVHEVALPLPPEEDECVQEVQQTEIELPLGAAHLTERDMKLLREHLYEVCLISRRSRLDVR